jgi:hypothetical protein
VTRVLQQFTQSAKGTGQLVEQLDEGGEAHIFAIRSQDDQPVWQTHTTLVVKLYKPKAASSVERASAEFDSLSRPHVALDGRTINGWKISTPELLYLCKSPLALGVSGILCARPG